MGSESSNSDSNSSRSDSDSASNSGSASGELEKMIFLKENENTIIKRVWIAKKSIHYDDLRVGGLLTLGLMLGAMKSKLINALYKINLAFTRFGDKFIFKHWAIILELSNGSYVNIQFGRNGFSLKEFNKADNEGKNISSAIKETWGQTGSFAYFCYLGNANYEYENLKRYLKEIKDKETKKFEEEGKTYYNLLHYNCQHFVCEIEKVLFNKIKIWHSFDYNLDTFKEQFFPNIDILKNKNFFH